LLHFQREHGARSDLQRQELRGGKNVDRVGRSGEPPDGLVGGADHMARQHRHDPRRQCRRDGAALVAPVLTLGEEQAIADDGAQDTDRRRRAAIIPDVVDQHVVDRIRAVQHEALAAEKRLHHDVVLIGHLRKDLERVGADRLEESIPGHIADWRRRARRNEGLRLVHIHGEARC